MRVNRRAQALSSVAVLAVTLGIASGAHAQATAQPADTEVDEVIVTGVFGARAIEQAPISITAVTEDQIEKQAVVAGAAELLKSVPGVFVNSGLGEIRNVVFSRGVSANSLDGASGYFYVSLQEDGLPVGAITSTNFGPDYFARPDIMLRRLEALRGGTAAITGPNAPGGIFNYISRTGKTDATTEVALKYGLEGDGENPYYRADFYTGGPIGESNLYYAVGGFYRAARGARDPGYNMNEGGQIRANVLWDYDKGSLLVGAKYLNDHSGFYEFLPARGFDNPKILEPFDNNTSVLPGKDFRHTYYGRDGRAQTFDPKDLVHSKAFSVFANWNHELSDRVQVENRFRYNDNRTDWNTGQLIFDLPITDFTLQAVMGNLFQPGVYTYRDRATGAVAATIQSFTGFDFNVTTNNLPNQQILANGVTTQFGLAQQFEGEEFQDELTFRAEVGSHQLAVGAYYMRGSLWRNDTTGGFGVAPIGPGPQSLYGVTYTAPDGTVYQLTDPDGLFSTASYGSRFDGTQKQFALFAGDTWEVTDRLTVEAGVRWESIKYDIDTNETVALFNFQDRLTTGGVDNNPLTVWDVRNAIAPARNVKRDFDFFNFSGSVAYRFTDEFNAYVRYTDGKKAPDFGLIAGLDTQAEIDLVYPDPQHVQQLELGLKYFRPGLRLQAFPFYSRLSNVGSGIFFVDLEGQFYSPPTTFGEIVTYGVELQANVEVTEQLQLDGALTLQKPKSKDFSTWTEGPTRARTDDVQVDIPDGDAENNPKIIARLTGTYDPTENISLFATYSYLGDRPANQGNAWDLPGFSTVDVGASWVVNRRLKLQANVNNLFDNDGIYGWARSGGFEQTLNRQSLTKADIAANPDQLLFVLPQQPRSFFITATVSF